MRSINEILDSAIVSTEEMIFVVEQYIFDKKGKVVTINLFQNAPSMDILFITITHNKLFYAFNISWAYFKEKEIN